VAQRSGNHFIKSLLIGPVPLERERVKLFGTVLRPACALPREKGEDDA